MKRSRRRILAVAALTAAIVGVAAPASAGSDACADRFPAVEWAQVVDGDVAVSVAGINSARADRFAGEIGLVVGWLSDEVGPFTATVCLVDESLAWVGDEFVSGSQRFHAYQSLEDRIVLLDTQRPGFVGPAAAFALTHQALWQNNGDAPFPEPIAGVIAYWYRARILDRLEYYHRDVMVENFFDTEAVIDWTASSQEPVMVWDPETNFRAIGDFVDFAVATYGTDILAETDPAVWTRIEGEWRTSLRVDLTGRETPTTDWILGVGIAAGILGVAAIAITLGLIAKHRRKRRVETAPPIPGLFTDG